MTSGYKSRLAREMMKIVFSRVGGTDLEAARTVVSALTRKQAEEIRAEAERALAA